MESSVNVGSEDSRALLVCDPDLCGREVAGEEVRGWNGTVAFYVGSSAFKSLVKTLLKGDAVTEDTLLRLWGVR